MKLNTKEKNDLLNYLLIKSWKNPISRTYKIHLKSIWCNARCPICKDWTIKQNKEKIIKNLYKSLSQILKDRVKHKHIQLLWWEPMLIFEDILKIVKIWNKYNISFDFPTNWSLLNIDKVDRLIKAWVDNFTFSIDYPDKNHDKWRSLPWAFDKIIELTKYLKDKQIKVQWNTVIWKFNLEKISDFKELYTTTSPNIHNFILIEKNWWKSEENTPETDEIQKIKTILENIKKSHKNISIIKNWFEDNNITASTSKLCFIPIKSIMYQIDEKWVKIYPCYYDDKEVTNIDQFSLNAITKWCNKCNSSLKNNYNNYMINLINRT